METETASHVRQMMDLAQRARNVFLPALAICAFLVTAAMLLGSGPLGRAPLARAGFAPVLLWALTSAAYGFHLLARANAGMAEKAGAIITADKLKALKEITKIRRRLRDSSVTPAE